MHAKKLPSVLELLEKAAIKSGEVQPNYECKMGWCTQCSCSKVAIEERFGPVVYRSEPSMPPTKGSVLPCISTQLKDSEDIDSVKLLFNSVPNAVVIKKTSVLARLPEPSEIGTNLKTIIISAGRLVVGQRTLIERDSVIVRNPKELAPDKYTEVVVSHDKFKSTYSSFPTGYAFQTFNDAKPIDAYMITENVSGSWKLDDGRMYYRNGKETVEVFVGTVITINGTAITDELAARLEIRRATTAEPDLLFENKPL